MDFKRVRFDFIIIDFLGTVFLVSKYKICLSYSVEEVESRFSRGGNLAITPSHITRRNLSQAFFLFYRSRKCAVEFLFLVYILKNLTHRSVRHFRADYKIIYEHIKLKSQTYLTANLNTDGNICSLLVWIWRRYSCPVRLNFGKHVRILGDK